MRNYKYALTLKGKIIARSQTYNGIIKRYNEMVKYLNDSTIICKCYKGTSDQLNIIEL